MRLLQTHNVPYDINDQRLYDYVQNIFDELPSRKSTKRAIACGEIKVNGQSSETGWWLKGGELIELFDPEHRPPKEYQLELGVVYEDDELAVIIKPAGLLVSGNQYRTVLNALSFNLSKSKSIDSLTWPLPAHRLDRLTSGLLLIAKTKRSRISFGAQFENQEIEKIYRAIVVGQLTSNGKLDNDITGKKAVTEFRSIRKVQSLKSGFLTDLELKPLTGRTHQIRIHLSEAGFPILGDVIYGESGKILRHKGLFLCATKIGFKHPLKNEYLQFEINAPAKFDKRMDYENSRWNKYRSV